MKRILVPWKLLTMIEDLFRTQRAHGIFQTTGVFDDGFDSDPDIDEVNVSESFRAYIDGYGWVGAWPSWWPR